MTEYPQTYTPLKTKETICLDSSRIEDNIFQKIEEISGENVFKCMQCGCCSAGCPLHEEMDISPNQIWKLLQMGEYDQVINSKSIWLCLSCFACAHRCPKGIDLANTMEAVRQLLLRKREDNIDISEIPEEELKTLPQIALISCLRKLSG